MNEVFPKGVYSATVQHPPELVTVWFGANDAVLPGMWMRHDGSDANGE